MTVKRQLGSKFSISHIDSVQEENVRTVFRICCITMNHTTFWKTFATPDNSTLSTLLSTKEVNNNSQIDSSDKDLENTRKWLWKIFSVVFLVFGLTGNLLAVLVFRKIGVSKRPTLFFLFVLAITDSVVLVTGLSRYWILNTFELDIRTLSDFGCKLHLLVIYLSMQYSSWILVFVCIERVIKTYLPLQFIRIVTYRRVYVSLIILFVVLLGVDHHYFWTNGINNFTKGDCSSLKDEYEKFDDFVFVYIDFTFLSAAPFAIMLICNVLLVRALSRIQRNRASMMHSIIFRRTQLVSNKLTKMLLVSTCYFLIATVPVSVVFIVDSYRRRSQNKNSDMHIKVIFDFVKTITYLIQYSHYSVNFYLYSMTNDKIWTKLKIVCGCRNEIKRSTITSCKMNTQKPSPSSSSRTKGSQEELETNAEAVFSLTGFETQVSLSEIEGVVEQSIE
ncbi:hypothetical protein CHS0354_014886 [Potamilus streckersoni]|uniref:G-protein coupled receptors family 1 profile domain-containing protein n=1 Tax=Potamilus streckersoni TaxID=2493646 RepID=A0AAE0TIV0_9BIVA|nr:hypothetical protein CHS0354_014886 [Potamilus streckersoni]